MPRRRTSGWLAGTTLTLGAVGVVAYLLRPRSAQAKALTQSMDLTDWKRAKLTEYHPDLPATASAREKREEGGANARSKLIPVITLDQHRSDPVKYPFATVAADDNLEGRIIKVGFGPRIYFAAYPNDIFRIYDTGGNFRGPNKVMSGGNEPFDIAVSYTGLRNKIGDRLTLYKVDWEDVLAFPQRLKRTPNT